MRPNRRPGPPSDFPFCSPASGGSTAGWRPHHSAVCAVNGCRTLPDVQVARRNAHAACTEHPVPAGSSGPGWTIPGYSECPHDRPLFPRSTTGMVRVAACIAAHRRRRSAGQRAGDAWSCCARAPRGRSILMVFPELGLSAYAIDDLLSGRAARWWSRPRRPCGADAAWDAPDRRAAAAMPAPYNCAVVVAAGRIVGVGCRKGRSCPTIASTTSIAGSRRARAMTGREIAVAGQTAPLAPTSLFCGQRSSDLLLPRRDLRGPVAPAPPSNGALAGATVLVNLSASNVVIGKAAGSPLPLCASQFTCAARPRTVFRRGPGREHHRSRVGRPGRSTSSAQLAATARFPMTR